MVIKKQIPSASNEKSIVSKEIVIICLILFLNILLCIPILKYPIVGDVPRYAEEASNIYHNHFYGYETPSGTVYETDVPPLFPLFSAMFMYIIDNPVFAVRIASFFFFALTAVLVYIFARRLTFNIKNSLIITALVVFNPLYFYFTTVISGTESISGFFFLLSLYLFFFRKENLGYYSLMGVVFGLYTLTRITAVIIILPFVIYLLILFFKEKRNRIGKLSLVFFSGIFGAIWLLRNYFLSRSVVSGLYLSGYSAEPPTIQSFFHMLGNFYFGSLPLLFLILTPFIIYQAVIVLKHLKEKASEEKRRNNIIFWALCLASFVLITLVVSTYAPRDVLNKTRQLIPFVSVLTIFGFIGFASLLRQFSVRRKKFSLLLVGCALVVYIISCLWVNYGFLKDNTDRIFPLDGIYSQTSYHRSQAIAWLSSNIETGQEAVVVTLFSKTAVQEGINIEFNHYLPRSAHLAVLDSPDEVSNQKRFTDYLSSLESGQLRTSRIYLLSEYDIDETKEMLVEEISNSVRIINEPDIKLKKKFRTDYEPYVYIYELNI